MPSSEEKSAISYTKYPKLPEDTSWSASAAKKRLAEKAGYDGSDKDTVNWSTYAKGFTWVDSENKETFGAYKLPHQDVENGQLKTNWRGVAAAMAALLGARGGVSIPDSDKQAVYNHLASHYKDFDKEVPEFKTYNTANDVITGCLDKDTAILFMDQIIPETNKTTPFDIAINSQVCKSHKNDDGSMTIEGYANTVEKDRMGDIVLPSAFQLTNFQNNPIILLNHSSNQPIGTMVDLKVDDKGLWIKAKISKAAEELHKVHTLILDGVLRAFSIGFKFIDGKYESNSDTFFITDLELLEVSVVSVPANQSSLFEISKAFEVTKEAVKTEYLKKQTIKDTPLDEESQAKDNNDNTNKGEKSIMPDKNDNSAPTTTDTPSITPEDVTNVVKSALQAEKDAEAKAAAEAEAAAEAKAAEEAKFVEAVNKAVANALKEQTDKEDKNAGIPQSGTRVDSPVTSFSKAEEESFMKTLDDLYLLSIMLNKPLTELKDYKKLPEQIQKSVVNTGGVSLAPVGFDNRLQQDIRAELKVAKLFNEFNMPLSDFRLPFNASAVTAEWITAGSTPTDKAVTFKNILFTAKKLMSVVGFNYEDEDDATVALLPTIRAELAYGMASLIDTTLISGTGAASDFRGVADYATGADVGGSHITGITGGATADFTPADVATARAKMGRYALNPRDVVLLMNLQDYYKLVDDTTVQTVTNYGADATLKTGELANIWGIPIIPTEAIPVPAATGDLRGLLLRSDRFMIGNRKGVAVEAWRDPRNQTKSLTSSMRMDFNPLVPLTAGELTSSETFVHRIEQAI